MSHEVKTWVYWVVLTICAIIAAICSRFLVKSIKYGMALIGGSSGAALALIICNTFGVRHPAAFWGILIASAILFTLMTFKMNNQFIIFSTALIGSYMLVRGVSLYAGGYPNEFILVQELDSGAFEAIPKTFYAYLVFLIISMIGGSYYQWKEWKREGPGYKHPYHYL